MATAKKTYVKYKTPVGTAVYPKLSKPFKWDESSQRSLPNPDGDFSTELSLSPKEAQPLIASITAAIKASGVKPKNLPYKPEERDGEKTGNTIFKFKAYGKDRDGNTNKIKFFDSVGQLITGVVVTGGSKIRLQGWISVAKMGARLNFREVQIIDLVEREGEGFDAVEGGSFKASDIEDNEQTTGIGGDEANETEETTSDEDEEF